MVYISMHGILLSMGSQDGVIGTARNISHSIEFAKHLMVTSKRLLALQRLLSLSQLAC
jgi:hypothetical protein